MSWIEMRPVDVWLFRDGKPFNAGENNAARSIFPPTPLTVQGALRQQISVNSGLSLKEYQQHKTPLAQRVADLIGAYEAQKTRLTTGAFQMRGPFPALRHEETIIPLLPCPADLFFNKDNKDNKDDKDDKAFWTANPTENPVQSDLSGYHFPAVREGFENLPNHWLTAHQLQKYLDNKKFEKSVICARDDNYSGAYVAYQHGKHIFPNALVFGIESRFGVSTDSAKSSAEEGMLYQAHFIRPSENIALLAEVQGIDNPDLLLGRMPLGGEQHQASNHLHQAVSHFPQKPESVRGKFKIVFLSPACFSDGWIPEGGDAAWSKIFGAKVKLLGAALYRPQKIGGWNSANPSSKNGGQRPMHNYVAAGSVYYFETEDEISNPPDSISESPAEFEDLTKIGFGQIVYGNWSYERETHES